MLVWVISCWSLACSAMRCILVLCFLFGMIIGLFVHTTCPSSEVFRCLPRHKEILDGMLGTNLICSSRGTMAASHRYLVAAVAHCLVGVDPERIAGDIRPLLRHPT
ncbi:hypothetical protein EDB19DRAFT_846201 [Suillus lakei]|nr:hypothetical protein EDB19DRAFT_846201 [Suillus lakei]